jgi:hypothetical protein
MGDSPGAETRSGAVTENVAMSSSTSVHENDKKLSWPESTAVGRCVARRDDARAAEPPASEAKRAADAAAVAAPAASAEGKTASRSGAAGCVVE